MDVFGISKHGSPSVVESSVNCLSCFAQQQLACHEPRREIDDLEDHPIFNVSYVYCHRVIEIRRAQREVDYASALWLAVPLAM